MVLCVDIPISLHGSKKLPVIPEPYCEKSSTQGGLFVNLGIGQDPSFVPRVVDYPPKPSSQFRPKGHGLPTQTKFPVSSQETGYTPKPSSQFRPKGPE